MGPLAPVRTARLAFRSVDEDAATDLTGELSACLVVGDCLFVASDETARLERLVTRDGGATWGHHAPVHLAGLFELPEGASDEVDVEALAWDGSCLWVAGSHGLKRQRPRPDRDGPDGALDRLDEVVCEPNRYLLGRLPLGLDDDGLPVPVPQGADGLRAAALPRKGDRNALARWLAKDAHVGRFVDVPCKENGLDVEGMAVRDGRVLLGLRGPVLRGWATVVELELHGKKTLKARKTDGDRRYRKRFLRLDGCGVRSMLPVGDDVLILAGPTMDLDGPAALWRWRRPWDDARSEVVRSEDVERVGLVPWGEGEDHPEGVALLGQDDGHVELLVVYDSPARRRLHAGGRSVDADVFRLPWR